MTIAVTGANGFVGRAVCAEVRRAGHVAVPLVRSCCGLEDEVAIGDLSREMPPVVNAAAVIHLAARAHVMSDAPATAESAYMLANVEGTRRAIEMASAGGAKRFVFVSSIKALGERTLPGRPFTETCSPLPEDAYGRSKLAAEQLALEMTAKAGMDLVIVRPPLVYGPGVKGNFATLIRIACSGLPLPIGRMRNLRSMISLGNLAPLLVHLAVHERAKNKIVLPSDQKDVSTPELVRAIAAAAHKKVRILPLPVSVVSATSRLVGKEAAFLRLAGNLQVDGREALQAVDWKPVQSFEDGIQHAVEAFLSSRNTGS